MKKKLINLGYSRGIIIDKAILNLFKVDDKTYWDIVTDGKSITLTPIKPGHPLYHSEFD